jgi:lipoate-protein ligase A
MKYYRLHTKDPYYNLAVEEYLLDLGEDAVMLWQNEPSVVIGVNQNMRAEVDMSVLRERGVHPVRRITGGGAVYHDDGNVNYTFIGKNDGGIDFQKFSSPIIEALASLGVTVTLSGRNDLCLPDGRKISGGAETVRGGSVLHHGTLLFNADLDALGAILTPSPEKLATKAIKSTRSRVANISELLPEIESADELIERIGEYAIRTLGAVPTEIPNDAKIYELEKRNSSEEWLYPTKGISSSIAITRSARYEFGEVRIETVIRGEIISDIKISGDFFGDEPISVLEDKLRGSRTSEIGKTVSDKLLAAVIKGMTVSELAELIGS